MIGGKGRDLMVGFLLGARHPRALGRWISGTPKEKGGREGKRYSVRRAWPQLVKERIGQRGTEEGVSNGDTGRSCYKCGRYGHRAAVCTINPGNQRIPVKNEGILGSAILPSKKG